MIQPSARYPVLGLALLAVGLIWYHFNAGSSDETDVKEAFGTLNSVFKPDDVSARTAARRTGDSAFSEDPLDTGLRPTTDAEQMLSGAADRPLRGFSIWSLQVDVPDDSWERFLQGKVMVTISHDDTLIVNDVTVATGDAARDSIERCVSNAETSGVIVFCPKTGENKIMSVEYIEAACVANGLDCFLVCAAGGIRVLTKVEAARYEAEPARSLDLCISACRGLRSLSSRQEEVERIVSNFALDGTAAGVSLGRAIGRVPERAQAIRPVRLEVTDDAWGQFIEDKIEVEITFDNAITVNGRVMTEADAVGKAVDRAISDRHATGVIVYSPRSSHETIASVDDVKSACVENSVDCFLSLASRRSKQTPIGDVETEYVNQYTLLYWHVSTCRSFKSLSPIRMESDGM